MIQFYIWYKTDDFIKNSVRIDSEYADALNLFKAEIGKDFSKIIEVEVCTGREYTSQAVDLEFAIINKVKAGQGYQPLYGTPNSNPPKGR